MADGALPLEATLADSVPAMPAVQRAPRREVQYYAALDLGTNNCRLLIGAPTPGGFRVVDSFSRIVRLGEGLAATGRLGEAAMERAIAALAACADKLARRPVRSFAAVASGSAARDVGVPMKPKSATAPSSMRVRVFIEQRSGS
jgi:exopolyphosphatase/guanosine-5'-triphosphate,3'-diphosphate pyrophosphatase